MAFFHVVHSETGKELEPEVQGGGGEWMLDTSGKLYIVVDGWNCEGGGGSTRAPSYAKVILGDAPPLTATNGRDKPFNQKPWKCDRCGKKFFTLLDMSRHIDAVHKD